MRYYDWWIILHEKVTTYRRHYAGMYSMGNLL